MRLIDADELRNRYEIIADPNGLFNRELTSWIEAAKIFAYMVNDAPTIDAAPVRRGEWVTDDDDNDDWAEPYCNKCGCFAPRGPAHFCPNCGAKMGKE